MQFNADEIFEMAEKIEVNGSRFYTKAASLVEDEKAKKLLEGFATWELEHQKAFAALRAEFREHDEYTSDPMDPYNTAGQYLQAIADGHVFDISVAPEDKLTGNETPEQIIRLAIEGEKNSIIFYLGIQDNMPGSFGKGRIDKIIQEEMQHITKLSDQLKALK